MQQKRKILAIFGDKRARAKILSGVVFVLMLIAGMAGLFISEKATAETILSEDFEDISEWTQGGATNVTLNSTVVHSGTYSAHFNISASSAYIYRNISGITTYVNMSVWTYIVDSTNSHAVARLADATSGVAYAIQISVNETNQPFIVTCEGGTWNQYYSTVTLQPDTWYHLWLIYNADDTGSELKLYYNGSASPIATASIGSGTMSYVVLGDVGTTKTYEMYLDDLSISNTTEAPTINISISISPDSDGDGRISFGSTNQTNVSMDSIDFITITENGDATVANLTITMQNIGGVIPTYYGAATNCYVYKWVGAGAPTSVNLSDTTNWQQVASFNSSYQATITGLSLGQGQSIYLAFRILDNDPENDGIAAGTYESTTTAHSVTAN